MPSDGVDLTRFQIQVAHVFFALPASEGFVLAGAAALIAHGLIHRRTQDLDFFRSTSNVVQARDAFEEAARQRQWAVQRIHDSETFVRLTVHGPDALVVDLCLDSAPVRPIVVSSIGPTFAPEELAGRKLLALFDRAEARDFTDAHALLRSYTQTELLTMAAQIDPGFDPLVLAQMMRTISRYSDPQLTIAGDDPDGLRREFHAWADELERADKTT